MTTVAENFEVEITTSYNDSDQPEMVTRYCIIFDRVMEQTHRIFSLHQLALQTIKMWLIF